MPDLIGSLVPEGGHPSISGFRVALRLPGMTNCESRNSVELDTYQIMPNHVHVGYRVDAGVDPYSSRICKKIENNPLNWEKDKLYSP
ncbi:MAG: hypothetical protein UW16_C0011G0010 [Microgenomates group bacterium GW2011_GWC1_44_10]|uniref:Transposase IS200-like domain-containing protein n=1 Tax=Candidatus Woesebacteria bacterium GW2011_GWA2_44_33 TaxID=1618564 RepID=A0A0G1J6X3_9BACT|nr:MAG: hypothetical protein UW16_C0011G0010 [Microgenomates group bacterium GW2011_GWC1_44_10]KKT67406.1 MAG: hypothetical protein UW60_C0007G0020 [Candidatus Woesebacteria bacterium GW2011_GWA2_44_33]